MLASTLKALISPSHMAIVDFGESLLLQACSKFKVSVARYRNQLFSQTISHMIIRFWLEEAL